MLPTVKLRLNSRSSTKDLAKDNHLHGDNPAVVAAGCFGVRLGVTS